MTAPSRQPGQGPDPLVARIAADLADIPRCPIDPDREPLLLEEDDGPDLTRVCKDREGVS